MKTAISIPDALFEEADRLAEARGLSRSELYCTALSKYLEEQRWLGVREKLDAVYAVDRDASRVQQEIIALQRISVASEKRPAK